MLKLALRYGLNLVAMVAAREGYLAAAAAGGRFVQNEAAMLPRLGALALRERMRPRPRAQHPSMFSDAILAALDGAGIPVRPYRVDVAAFWAHVHAAGYPANYAAGPMSEGGSREQKLLEYFV
jgi:hypothetical protein